MIPCYLLLAALSMPLPVAAGQAAAAPVGEQHNVVFTEYSPLSRSTELVRRLLSPLNAWRVNQAAMRPGHALREQPLDLAHEQFAVHVPAREPPGGYALLVFVPPWPEATVPSAWTAILDRHGMIYVSAANSGNDADVLDRRVPLALLAAQNIMQRYPVDPRRVYIGGFSGGSRVAEHIALGYPDLFHGALLMAGSDPIGTAQLPIPPADLFRQFQDTTRLIYLTGQNDAFHLDMDSHSQQSLRDWCVFHVNTVAAPWTGHELPDPAPLGRALDLLDKPVQPDADKLAHCRAGIDKTLNAQLQQAENLLTDGKPDAAQTLLDRIDAHDGGLAAPRSTGLLEKITAKH
ncbi:alpha/beta hydrolase family protein [Rhodanobacter koreensis]